MKHNFDYKWNLKDGYPKKKNGLKVFSTFACGGGSTMGYKLAGYDVIGANDIDEKMAKVYKENHNPKHYYLMSITKVVDMAKNKELPDEFYNLDILDGSPPCKTFSLAGKKDNLFKKDHKYNSRTETEVISDLFFNFIELVTELKPKIVVAENVKGLTIGNSRAYLKEIIIGFEKAGYDTQAFVLNASTMGVPQKRERIFFICRRKDLKLPNIDMSFSEIEISFREVESKCGTTSVGKELSPAYSRYWLDTPNGQSFSKAHPKGSYFTTVKVSPNKAINTIVAAHGSKLVHYKSPNEISKEALALCGSYPLDYQYPVLDPQTLIGRSVPPVMMANIAKRIQETYF